MPAPAPTAITLPRLILGASATIAIVAVGLAAWNRDAKQGEKAPKAAASPAQAGDVGTMISQLEARLKDNPADAEGWRMLGWAFFETGRYAESASAYGRATQIEPTKGEYWSSLGEARVLAGPGSVTPDARTAFQWELNLDPKDPRARYFLAVAKDMDGNHKGAIADWIALLRDTPAGAPWEADVRRIVAEVAAREKIDISKEMASLGTAVPAPGSSVATAAIPGPSPEEMRAAAALPKGQQDMMIQGMVDGLESRLQAKPDNAQGWIMLMRSRMHLGQTAKAAAALTSARAAFANAPEKLEMINSAARELGVPAR